MVERERGLAREDEGAQVRALHRQGGLPDLQAYSHMSLRLMKDSHMSLPEYRMGERGTD